MADSFRMSFDPSQLNASLDKITVAAESAVRPAAQIGAEILYSEAKLLCPQSPKAHWFYGRNSKQTGVKYYFEPGALRAAIYQAYSKDNSRKAVATYHIAWNHQKVPYGFMVEFGTPRAPARSFIRKSFVNRHDDALQKARSELVARVRESL